MREVNGEMKGKILSLFKNLEEEPLFFIESGSRLWGIDSPDSDFDIRGFHIQSKNQYFDYKKHREIIEIVDGDFDFVSYGIDKMFSLILKSNPSVLEWIRADLIYINNFFDWDSFKKSILANINHKTLYYHYLSIAKSGINFMKERDIFTYKKLFYSLRGLLSANVVAKNMFPELLIDNLFEQNESNDDILLIAKKTLAKKRESNEKQELSIEERGEFLPIIDEYIKKLEQIDLKVVDRQDYLDSILEKYSNIIKSRFYS
ncbi:nucleotidyltransferase domain-containing protein [bacterium]|nr:nucleotidyltransferase domain-containing protein [bacterium]